MKPYEQIIAENSKELIWLRYRRLLSPIICKKIIYNANEGLSEEKATEKAEGVASAVGASLGYWESKSNHLNAWIVSRYYALMHLTIAEQVASGDENLTLKTVQRHTEHGHGIDIWQSKSGEYPSNYLIYLRRSGYFSSYLKYRGFDDKDYLHEGRIRSEPDDDQRKFCVSLGTLLRTVPELNNIIEEYLDAPPLSIHIIHSSHNMSVKSEELEEYNKRHGGFSFKIPDEEQPEMQRTYIDLLPSSNAVTIDYVKAMGLPIKDIECVRDENHTVTLFRGYVDHPRSDYWYQHLKIYKSNYCGTSIVSPIFGKFDDPILLHFMTLYGLSITARYLPDLWRELTVGELSHISALIEHYLSLVDNIIPLNMLERITGVRTIVVQPGSLHAPI